MLQRTEPEETVSTEVRIATPDEELPGKELSAQDLDTELAELAAYIQASATRSKNHYKTVKKTILKRSLIVMAPVLIVLAVSLFAWRTGLGNPSVFMWVSLATSFLSMLGSGFLSRWTPNNKRAPVEQERRTAQRLIKIDDVRAVPLVFDALRWSADRTEDPQLWQALGRLLPRLTQAQAQELGSERQGRLALWLWGWDKSPKHPHLAALGNQPVLGVLHVLAQLGRSSLPTHHPVLKDDVEVLNILETWAAGQKLGQDPEVRQAAAASFEAIKNKIAMAHSSAQLLRASAAASPPLDSLLRPAEGAQETDPQELLRATSTAPHDDDHA